MCSTFSYSLAPSIISDFVPFVLSFRFFNNTQGKKTKKYQQYGEYEPIDNF